MEGGGGGVRRIRGSRQASWGRVGGGSAQYSRGRLAQRRGGGCDGGGGGGDGGASRVWGREGVWRMDGVGRRGHDQGGNRRMPRAFGSGVAGQLREGRTGKETWARGGTDAGGRGTRGFRETHIERRLQTLANAVWGASVGTGCSVRSPHLPPRRGGAHVLAAAAPPRSTECRYSRRRFPVLLGGGMENVVVFGGSLQEGGLSAQTTQAERSGVRWGGRSEHGQGTARAAMRGRVRRDGKVGDRSTAAARVKGSRGEDGLSAAEARVGEGEEETIASGRWGRMSTRSSWEEDSRVEGRGGHRGRTAAGARRHAQR